MPDKRKHRGKHPEDDRLFDAAQHQALRSAVGDYSWLLTRGYAPDSALKLVGDHYTLTARQRLAVMRSSCPDQALEQRRRSMTMLGECRGRSLGIDGYNLLITVESALSGALILVGRDGCHRDLASVHGTYRKVEETKPALDLIIEHLAEAGIARIDWYLDQPVSNSGRLKAFMAEILEARAGSPPADTEWNIELVPNPDAVLSKYAGPVASSDSVILDQCALWVNLPRDIIEARVPHAHIVDLSTSADWSGDDGD